MYKVSVGDPGVCSCESPKCAGSKLMYNHVENFKPAGGCYYYAVGGGITAGDGHMCNTWRADYKSCAVFPGSTDGNCSRLYDLQCSMQGTATTITGKVDRNCTILPYEDCHAGDICAPHYNPTCHRRNILAKFPALGWAASGLVSASYHCVRSCVRAQAVESEIPVSLLGRARHR